MLSPTPSELRSYWRLPIVGVRYHAGHRHLPIATLKPAAKDAPVCSLRRPADPTIHLEHPVVLEGEPSAGCLASTQILSAPNSTELHHSTSLDHQAHPQIRQSRRGAESLGGHQEQGEN